MMLHFGGIQLRLPAARGIGLDTGRYQSIIFVLRKFDLIVIPARQKLFRS